MQRWVRNIALVVGLVVIIVLSFWLSFMIGKQMLVPTKKLPTQYLITEEAKPVLPPEVTLEVQGITLESITLEAVPTIENKPVEEKIILRPIPPKKQKAAVVIEKPVKAISGEYTVQLGAFSHYKNAQTLLKELKSKGFDAEVKSSGRLYKVQSGSFDDMSEARAYLSRITAAGFECVIRRIN